MKPLIFESPPEAAFDAQDDLFFDVMKSLFGGNASAMVINTFKKGNPAFKDWSKRLIYGEKLPRGKYFRQQERMRAVAALKISTVKFMTIHA